MAGAEVKSNAPSMTGTGDSVASVWLGHVSHNLGFTRLESQNRPQSGAEGHWEEALGTNLKGAF
jgi:hypothetical protein